MTSSWLVISVPKLPNDSFDSAHFGDFLDIGDQYYEEDCHPALSLTHWWLEMFGDVIQYWSVS